MVDRRLGRGLDFFLSGGRQTTPANPKLPDMPKQEAGNKDGDVRNVGIGELSTSPYQPRKTFGDGELAQLAESLKGSGMLQPILARSVAGKLEIVAGERRWRAAKLAGLEQVPVLIREITDEESAVFGLVENLQREDLNAIEKAEAFRVLMTKLGTTQEEVAKRVGMERSTVANFMRLLDLPAGVQAHVSRGTLSMGHARALLGLGDRDLIERTAEESIRQSLSVRALEAKVKAANEALSAKPGAKPKAAPRTRPVWLNEIEESLVEALGTPVTVRYGRKRSQIMIECAGREEFERIFERLKNC
ncbi:MAG: ParB/RepB/Spo0J family partition protein [Planctomycetes bacterium]|nr:ParB/RepB/Spo0J family partition protein [Planctomycetota bacterium]